ncbi:ribosome maturation factor RimP [Clostridium sp. DL1XJH146]
MNNKLMIDKLIELFLPIINQLGYELYYVEYVNEDDENFLRIYIDNVNGIDLDDCTKVSRTISELLDEIDPIDEAYFLEISSPGVERQLFTDKHLETYLGSSVTIELINKFNGKNTIDGNLISYTNDLITIKNKGSKISIKRINIEKVNLKIEF